MIEFLTGTIFGGLITTYIIHKRLTKKPRYDIITYTTSNMYEIPSITGTELQPYFPITEKMIDRNLQVKQANRKPVTNNVVSLFPKTRKPYAN